MAQGNDEFQSKYFKKHLMESQARGEARGKAEEKTRGVLRVLAARGIVVSPEQEARILACRELATLDRWIEKAITVAAAEELFSV